jgi:hypothetical protein
MLRPAHAARSLALALLLFGATQCKAVGGIIGGLGGTDSSCDRRTGLSDNPQPFCQEIIETVAGAEFREDCSNKLKGTARESPCPREHIVAGCQVNVTNDDGSVIIDWFYSVDHDGASPIKEQDRVRTREQVAAKCAEPGRYEGGATFLEAPK